MAFPAVTYTNNGSAASALVSNAAEAGLDVSGLNPISQLQSVVANLLLSNPSTATVPAGSVTSGTFGANDSDTGTYVFPTQVNFGTKVVSTTALATPSALAATAFNAFASTVSGAAIMGFGTSRDVTLMNRAGTVVLGVTANTTGVTMAGALAMAGALSGVTTIVATGVDSQYTAGLTGSANTGVSYGLLVTAGTNSSDNAVLIRSAGLTSYLTIRGDGLVTIGSTATFGGNVLIGGSVGATAAKTLALSNSATAPTTSVDLVHLYAADISAGNASLAIYSEAVVNAGIAVASTHRFPITINGTQYAFLLTTVLA